MEQIKHYKIIKKIGSGGLGNVYKAFDTILERDVAIKILHPGISGNKQNIERLLREARSAAKLIDQHIVTIYEVGEIDSTHYIAMELVTGRSMNEVIFKEGPLSQERAVNLAVQILKGLSKAHKVGIFHRDIKPDNIIVTPEDHIKILDFGIAKMTAKTGLTVSGEVLGTIEFMAPEQMIGEEIDQRCDIYAAGTILYLTLTKQLPFSGETPVEILFKKLNEEPVNPSHYNKNLKSVIDKIILKAIASNKNNRWENASEMINALETLIDADKKKIKKWDELELDFDFDDESDIDLLDSDKIFVGRDSELKELINIYRDVTRSNGRTVVVSGEAGVGKTRLSRQLRQYVSTKQSWVLYGNCLYQDGMDSYLPFIDALRDFFSRKNELLHEDDRQKLIRFINEKTPVLGQFTERFTTNIFSTNKNGKPEKPKGNLFESIHILFAKMSQMNPIVIIMDDIQWADEASLKLFHYLSRQIQNERILLYGICRTDHYDLVQNGKPKLIVDILARMRRENLVTDIFLNSFKKEDCDRLIDTLLQNSALSDEFYKGVFQETKGNPFFVIETLKLYREKNLIELRDSIWFDNRIDFKLKIPNRVEDIFVRRLTALSEEEREILQIASVIGYRFDPSLLAAVMDKPKIEILKMLQKFESDLHILSSNEKYFQFEHPMLADILYKEIPRALSSEYHLMIVREMEIRWGDNLGAMVGEAANHYKNGGEYEKAIPLLLKAGQRAFELAAYRDSEKFLADLLLLIEKIDNKVPDDVPLKDVYFKLAISQEENGDLEKSIENYKKIESKYRKEEDYKNLSETLMRIGRVYDKLGKWEDSYKAYIECLELAQKHNIKNVISRVYNKLGVYHFHQANYDEAISYFQKTIHFVDSEYGEIDKAHAYSNIGVIANIIRGNHGIALSNFEKAINIYEKHDLKKDLAVVYHNLGLIYSDKSMWVDSIKAFENCLSLTNEGDSRHLKALTYLNMGKTYARSKKLKKAKPLVEKALKMLKRMADLVSVAEAYQIYGIIFKLEGDFYKSQKYFLDAIQIFKNKDFKEGLAETYENYGELCQINGYYEESLGYFKEAVNLYKNMKLDNKVKKLTIIIDELEDQHILEGGSA